MRLREGENLIAIKKFEWAHKNMLLSEWSPSELVEGRSTTSSTQPRSRYAKCRDTGQVIPPRAFESRAGIQGGEASTWPRNIRLFETGVDIQQVAEKVSTANDLLLHMYILKDLLLYIYLHAVH